MANNKINIDNEQLIIEVFNEEWVIIVNYPDWWRLKAVK